jgi:hypothetical protein
MHCRYCKAEVLSLDELRSHLATCLRNRSDEAEAAAAHLAADEVGQAVLVQRVVALAGAPLSEQLWAEVQAAQRSDGAPYLCEKAVRAALQRAGQRADQDRAERNIALNALWRILGCPDGAINVALAVTAPAYVDTLRRQLADKEGRIGRQRTEPAAELQLGTERERIARFLDARGTNATGGWLARRVREGRLDPESEDD